MWGRWGIRAGFCRSSNPLDLLLGLEYRLRCGRPPACVARPRERSFIVAELPELTLEPGGRYCVYALAKRGLPSLDAARLLARRLGVNPRQASIAGLKDTEATTLQYICLPCPREPPAIVAVPGRLWARLVGRASRCPRRGVLRGNRFTIVLEPVSASCREVVEAAEALRGAKLPAYYGYQRFGTRRPNTHLQGLALLRGDLAWYARELLGSPYPDESPATARCRASLWRSEECQGSRLYEATVARRAASPADLPALLPRGVAEIQLAALQAYIFNRYLSLRLARGHSLDEKLPGERLVGGRPHAPVPGIGYRLGTGGEAAELLEEALEPLGIGLEDLAEPPPGLPRLRPYWRPVYTVPEGLEARIIPGCRVAIAFSLEKGMYATLVLRELAEPPECV
ncbi:tRNA pseudouridine(13) synthase TruD [Pyrodictium abyssi]|uniref:tRNA pseudouridine(13) synthase TruD n=1 Tax=Pyrodictium abyssi TaxID=54256 RepID=A0ABM8IZ20_9CREN|nr:tRNA pseudouridine(13) synthase TruD [Pyrodictium abyssi]